MMYRMRKAGQRTITLPADKIDNGLFTVSKKKGGIPSKPSLQHPLYRPAFAASLNLTKSSVPFTGPMMPKLGLSWST